MDSKLYSRKAFVFLATALRLLGKPLLWILIALLQSYVWTELIFKASLWRTTYWVASHYKALVRGLRARFEHHASRQVIGWNLACITVVVSIVAPRIVLGNDSVDAPLEGQKLSAEAMLLSTELALRSPLDQTYLTQGYHTGHLALDLKGQIGDPIHPIMKGKVVEVSANHSGYGNMVRVVHGAGLETLYAHMSAFKTHEGDAVTTDSVIGLVGTTGNSTGPHLHLELIDHGNKVNPMTIIGGRF